MYGVQPVSWHGRGARVGGVRKTAECSEKRVCLDSVFAPNLWQCAALLCFRLCLMDGRGVANALCRLCGVAAPMLRGAALAGYTAIVWCVVFNFRYTGLLVSWIMKFADTIVKVGGAAAARIRPVSNFSLARLLARSHSGRAPE